MLNGFLTFALAGIGAIAGSIFTVSYTIACIARYETPDWQILAWTPAAMAATAGITGMILEKN